MIEHEIIDDLVFNRLIKRRIDIAFTREFSKASIETTIKEIELRERSGIQYWLRIAGLPNQYPIEREGAGRLSPDRCIFALKGLQGRICDRGVQLREDLRMIRAAYGDQPTENAAVAMYKLLAVAAKKIEQGETAETKEDPGSKKEILETLKTEIQQQELREDLAQRKMAIECASDIQEPLSSTLEPLLRTAQPTHGNSIACWTAWNASAVCVRTQHKVHTRLYTT